MMYFCFHAKFHVLGSSDPLFVSNNPLESGGYFIYTGVLISPYLDQEGNKLMFLSEWREFPSAPCLAGGEGGKLVTARVSMLLKSRASLTCFRACFLPGRAKDLSAPGKTRF